MKTARFYLFLIVVLFSCFACAAAQIALEKKDLKVETKMSDTIFLDIEKQPERTIFVDIRNTSDKDIDIKSLIQSKIQGKGYVVTSTPGKAGYILQGNVLYVGKANPSALRESLYAGYGGVLGGALAGGVLSRSARGAGAGGLLGGVAELVAGSLVKDVTYSIVTDLMISERSSDVVSQTIKSDLHQGKGSKILQKTESKERRKRYQTRILSTANKVNLKFEEAINPLVNGLARSIAGIF